MANWRKRLPFGVFLSKFLLKIAGTKYKNSICHVCVVLPDESGAFAAGWEVAVPQCVRGQGVHTPSPGLRGGTGCDQAWGGCGAGSVASPGTHTRMVGPITSVRYSAFCLQLLNGVDGERSSLSGYRWFSQQVDVPGGLLFLKC